MNRIQYFIVAIFLGALLTQGFQCTSPEMSTARVAVSKKDISKAIEFYNKELKKNPTNYEAMYELAEIDLAQAKDKPEKLNDALDMIIKAKQTSEAQGNKAKPSKYAEKYKEIEFNAWVLAFNSGVDAIQKIELEPGQKAKLGPKAVELFEKCILVNPDNSDNYSMLGLAHSTMDNPEKATESFEKYNKVMEKELEFIAQKGLTIGQHPDDVKAILGQPKETTIFKYFLNPDNPKVQDTVGIMIYKIDAKDFIVYTRHNTKTSKTGVTGWRFDPPQFYRVQPFDFNVTPTAELARISFDKKDYNKAISYVELLKKIDPTNMSANQFLVQILEAQGDPNKALQTLANFVKSEPNNPGYKSQYGDMLVRQKKYVEAIAQYEAALAIYQGDYKGIDKELRTGEIKKILGSAYKNQAVEIQRAEFDKLDKDPNYKINEATYLPILDKSKAIFEELTRKQENSANYIMLLELADIYIATNAKDKLNSVLNKLDILKDEVEDDDMEFFLLNMINYYDKTQNQAKLDEYNELFKELKK